MWIFAIPVIAVGAWALYFGTHFSDSGIIKENKPIDLPEEPSLDTLIEPGTK